MTVPQAFLVPQSAPRVRYVAQSVVQARRSLEVDRSGSYVMLVFVETNDVCWRLHGRIVRYRSDFGEGKLAEVFRAEDLPCIGGYVLATRCFSRFAVGSWSAQSTQTACLKAWES